MFAAALARLFSDPWGRPAPPPRRREPRLIVSLPSPDRPGRVEPAARPPAHVGGEPSRLALPAPSVLPSRPAPHRSDDLHAISPRRFAELTHELYLDGTLTWAEFQMVGFPSELDPRYDETIGALIGDKANPDLPRDMLGQWEQRVGFERRFNPDPGLVETAESALDKLRRFNDPAPALN